MPNGTFSQNIVVSTKPWVLIVEDDKDMRNALSDGLRAKGYNSIGVESFSKAIAKIQNQKFACIILDLNLGPDSRGGEEILNNIKSSFLCTLNKDTPILLCSGNIAPKVIHKHKDLITDALAKPFKMDQLLEKIKKCIEVNASRLKAKGLVG